MEPRTAAVPPSVSADEVLAATRRWLERAVIGLNLCPFARAPHVRGQIRWVVSQACDTDALLDELLSEIACLADADPANVETTLLVHPRVLADFDDYNDFLGLADRALQIAGVEGVLQIASFHPDYRFADAEEDDPQNLTNRSPYPMLHLIREASIDRATQSFPDAAGIYLRNIETVRGLGFAGWRALLADT